MKKSNYRMIEELRHELHSHPELSNHESWTKARLMKFLTVNTSLEIHDEGKWFWAVRRAGRDKANIAFRADFDALPIEELCDLPYKSRFPGVSHKCGHDGHSAALCGLGLEMEKFNPDKNVFLLFQHAEETGRGALDAIDFITENKIDEIYTFHNLPGCPLGTIAARYGSGCCASKGMIIEMTGEPAHASLPEAGRNPAYALANVVSAIPSLNDPGCFSGFVLCTVVQLDVGGHAFGTAAGSGRLLVTLRAENQSELDNLQAAIERLSLEQSDKYNLECAFFFEDEFPETRNEAGCVDKIFAAAGILGYPVLKQREAFRASEDFGQYLKKTRGALFFIGCGENAPALHTANYDFPDAIMENAVEIFKGLIKL